MMEIEEMDVLKHVYEIEFSCMKSFQSLECPPDGIVVLEVSKVKD